jgi:hypothetical protein
MDSIWSTLLLTTGHRPLFTFSQIPPCFVREFTYNRETLFAKSGDKGHGLATMVEIMSATLQNGGIFIFVNP